MLVLYLFKKIRFLDLLFSKTKTYFFPFPFLHAAKNHGNSTKTTPSGSHETGSVQRNELVHVSENEESSSSSREAIPSSTGECSLNKENGRDDLGDCRTEQPEVNFSNGVSSTTKQPEDANFSDKVPSSINLSNEVSSLMKHFEDVNISDEGSSSKVQPEEVNFSNEVSSPMEQPEDANISDEGSSSKVQPEDVNFSNEVSSPMEQPEDVNISNEGSSSNVHPEDVNSSNEVSSPMEQQPEDVNVSNEGSSSNVQPKDVNFSNEVSSPMEQQPEDVNISNEGSSSNVQPEDVNISNEVSSPTEQQPEDVNISNEGSSPNVQPEDANFSNEVSSPMEQPEDVNISNEGSSSNVQPEDINISNEGSSSNVRPEDVNFSNEVSALVEQPEDVNFSNQVSSLMEQPADVFSNEVSLPREQPEDVNFSNEAVSSVEQPEDVDYLDGVLSPKEQSEDVDFLDEVSSPKEQPKDINFSNEVSSSKQQPDNLNFLNEVSLSTEKPEDVSFLNEVSSSTELMCHENEEPQPIVGANTVYEDDEGGFYSRSLSSDSLLASRERSSEVTAQRLTGECMKQDTPMSHSNEQPEQSDDDVLHGYMYRSPTARSFYGYDGSVSSYDGTDDQVLDRSLHQPNRTFKAREFVGPEERSRGKFLVNSNLEMQRQTRNASSILSGKEHYPKKYGKWNRDDFPESTRYDQPVRNWMRLERGEFPSRLPFYGRDFPAGYENDIPSSPGHPDYQHSSSFHSPDMPERHEQERIKLLKMLCELQDQINKKHNGRDPTRVGWKGKHIAKSYNHEASEEEIFNDLNYPRYPDQYRTGRNWPQHRKFSRMAFSGEAPNSRRQADYSCLHCCPQDRWYSAQLRPPVPCCENGLHGARPGHRCYHHCTSTHSSPLQCMDSEIPIWTHGAKSEDQGHKNHEAKLYWKEKPHQVKRHIQPIAGGAPFLTCYHCSHLLQLPADFLLFKRRCHGLRCGACYELLKFSVENRTHIVQYTPNAVDPRPPPPSEVDDVSRTLNSVGLPSTALVSDCSPAYPVSCSDDYGLSFCKSFSTEGETAFITPPFGPMGERNKKLILKKSQNKYKEPVETYKSIGSSSNMSKPEKSSTEIEELPPTAGSPLYRLMDYSSPSAMIYGSGMDTD